MDHLLGLRLGGPPIGPFTGLFTSVPRQSPRLSGRHFFLPNRTNPRRDRVGILRGADRWQYFPRRNKVRAPTRLFDFLELHNREEYSHFSCLSMVKQPGKVDLPRPHGHPVVVK